MPEQKTRILHVGEASFLSSGYAIYAREIQQRLHDSGKYEIAELACYGSPQDPRRHEIPWQYFGNLPSPGDESGARDYDSRLANQYGAWRFNDVVTRFRPDIVWDIRDHWMLEHEEMSPHRRHFHWAIMPTVDARPQCEQWLSTFINADAVLTYSDWGQKVLRTEGGGLIRLRGTAPPAADLDNFMPMDKPTLRKKFGFDSDINIVGTVMRNQPRKLYPQLIRDFATFLRQAKPDLASKTYLYLHTSYPDQNSWDIPCLIKESGISHKILVSYRCKICHCVFPSFFQDARGACVQCGGTSATMPNISDAVDRKTLACIINLFDIYVQYANCLSPEQEVLLRRGWTRIDQVVAGDEALTHMGRWRPVVKTFRHQHGDEPLDVTVWDDYESMTITSGHPVYAITAESCDLIRSSSLRENIGHRLRNHQDFPELAFVSAAAISPGDMLAYRIDDETVDVDSIDLVGFANEPDTVTTDRIIVKNGKAYPRHIDVDLEFCRFLGLYVTNGSANLSNGSGAVRISCHLDGKNNQSLALSIILKMQDQAATVKSDKNRLAVEIEMYSNIHARYFLAECGKRATKRLPAWTSHLPVYKQCEIIRGMCMADGHFISSRNVTIYATISRYMAHQMKEMLRRCRFDFNVRLVKKDGNRHPQYRFEIPGDLASGLFVSNRSSSRHLYHGPWHLMQVKSVAKSLYHGPVYNFEVLDDNSYLTKNTIVHNSEGFAIPQVEAAACGVPIMSTDYSAMSDVVRKLKGYPIAVDGYDVEPLSGCLRARPDGDDFVRILNKYFSLSPEARTGQSYRARMAAEEHYTWKRSADRWMEVFDSLPQRPLEQTWLSLPRLHKPGVLPSEFPSNEACVRWAIENILGRPEMVHSYMALRMIRDLNWGTTLQLRDSSYQNENSILGDRRKSRPFGTGDVVGELTAMCNYYNECEDKRWQARSPS